VDQDLLHTPLGVLRHQLVKTSAELIFTLAAAAAVGI
jgi:hypothetical protein